MNEMRSPTVKCRAKKECNGGLIPVVACVFPSQQPVVLIATSSPGLNHITFNRLTEAVPKAFILM